MAKKPAKKPANLESVFVDVVNSMLSDGSQMLTRDEYEKIVAEYDAYGCILIPKDADTADEPDTATP
jgi:hypothetical protein